MPDSLLTNSQKNKLHKAVKTGDYKQIVYILESVKTAHAGTAKTKDKRFVIKEQVSHIKANAKNEAAMNKAFFNTGVKFCSMNEDVAKQIGVSLLWRGYKHDKKKTKSVLLAIADHPNWEVRESAGGAFANVLFYNNDFYDTLKKWAKNKSPNVRRAVVIGSLGLRDTNNPADISKAFRLLKPLMYDSSTYVKKNLGPFVLGSYYGNSYPKETFKQLNQWIKIKDENVRWNVAMAFNNSFGNKYPDEALKYLRILSRDTSPMVQRAVKSTLNSLKKRNNNLKI